MSKLNITIEIDGKQHPIKDGSWYLIAPCGCAAGVTVMECMGQTTLTEDAAWAAFYDRKDIQERDQGLGYRVEVGLRQDVVERMGACGHTPKYGHEETPTPDGHKWGLSRSTRIHLYETDEKSLWRKTALCGAEHQSIDLQYARHQRLECAKCAAAAKRIAA